MTATAKKLGEEIQQLPLNELLELHEHLIASIHEKEDSQTLEAEFQNEIGQRVKEIESGKAEGEDPFKALDKM